MLIFEKSRLKTAGFVATGHRNLTEPVHFFLGQEGAGFRIRTLRSYQALSFEVNCLLQTLRLPRNQVCSFIPVKMMMNPSRLITSNWLWRRRPAKHVKLT